MKCLTKPPISDVSWAPYFLCFKQCIYFCYWQLNTWSAILRLMSTNLAKCLSLLAHLWYVLWHCSLCFQMPATVGLEGPMPQGSARPRWFQLVLKALLS